MMMPVDIEKPDRTELVSIVIPTYNRREAIEKCVLALVAQTYEPFEVIVIDDGSTDDTLEALESLRVKFPKLQLRVIENETNLGANPSRNRGIRAAGGSVVAFLDSDCVATPKWLSRLMDGFTSPRVAAVTGLVVDPVPSNIWELTLKGTHRIAQKGPTHRLVAGNMVIRRDLLLAHSLDEDYGFEQGRRTPPDVNTSGRSDEEGVILKLQAEGHLMNAQPDAAVFHEHYYDRRSFFRQAYKGGRSAARLVYKFHLKHRIDMIPFIATYATLPIALLWPRLLVIPAICFTLALAAITYNDLFRKGKTPLETLRSFPSLLAYYHVRLSGYVSQTVENHLGETGIRRERL